MGAFFIARDLVDSHIEYQMTDELTAQDPANPDDPEARIGVTLTSNDNIYYLLTAGDVSIAKKTDKDSRLFATTTKENYSSGVDAADLVVELQKLQKKEKLL